MMDYQSLLNQCAYNLKPSGIRKFFDIAAEMDDVISLSVGEPDFKTPWHVREAGIDTLQKGRTQYSPNRGFTELLVEISRYANRRFGLEYDPKTEVLVTVGGSEAIDLCFRALLNPGDEVLIPEPCFVCYEPLATIAGGVPVPVVTKVEDEFRLTAEQLRAAITERTKILVLPFPNNPTGAVMRREHLEAIADVLRDTNIMVLSDEIYCELTYGEERHISFAEIPGMRERTIVVNGFSKSHAMTGWRMGYVCAPQPIIAAMTKLHQFGIMSAPTTSQYAAVEAMRNGDKDIEHMREEYDRRRRYLVENLNRIGLSCFEPKGAFYVFPDIRSTGLSSAEFCERFLLEEKVAVIPGSAFGPGGEGFVRACYAASMKDIAESIARMDNFLTNLRRKQQRDGE